MVKNRARIARQQREYSARHRLKVRAARRKYAAEHRDIENARCARYAGRHPEIRKKVNRNYYLRHRRGFDLNHIIRRARKAGADGKFTLAGWGALKEKYGNVCLCCYAPRKLEPDHIIPLSRGGNNFIDNIQPLCGTCNRRKKTKTTDYRSLFAFHEAGKSFRTAA